jgi:hypothetical protein
MAPGWETKAIANQLKAVDKEIEEVSVEIL